MNERARLHGLVAEFDDAAALLKAARETYAAGYRRIDAYAPFPVHGLAEALGFRRGAIAKLVLAGGVLGGLGGFGLQYWVSVAAYPVNIGGRPLNSWPSFIPVTFELTILIAAFAAVLGMLALNGLPQPWHPLFEVEAFGRASQDRFFLEVTAADERFDADQTRAFLHELGPTGVYEVPA